MSASATVLVCDDEESICFALGEHLRGEGYEVLTARDGRECIDAVRERAPGLILLDLHMPVMGGMEVLRTLRQDGVDVPIVVVTAEGGIDSAVEATRLGATAYLQKPFDLREISMEARKALAEDRLKSEVRYLRRRDRAGYGAFIGQSKSLDRLLDTLRRLERADAPTVLITGESGTGKDVLARAIHTHGKRKEGVFVEVDCASLPEQLIESELFGHERGAFTDARTTKRGLFEVADKGVVFLDEIAEMSPGTQAKLLRALESRTFKRVGGVGMIQMDVSVIAATNRDLKQEVASGHFREDLFFRLNVIPIHIPPLRERRDDIPLLVSFFLAKFASGFDRRVSGVRAEAMALLQQYRWPGNVRELKNVLERIVILGAGEIIEAEELPPEVCFATPDADTAGDCPFALPEDGVDLIAVERGLISQALHRAGGNQAAAARLLRISRYTLRYRLRKFGLAQT